MASGYEKEACGVDPNKGWGKPSHWERRLTLLVTIVGVAAVIGLVATLLW